MPVLLRRNAAAAIADAIAQAAARGHFCLRSTGASRDGGRVIPEYGSGLCALKQDISEVVMPRKLKTFVTESGFFELAVAAPSMKAALQDWGIDVNLFQQGLARRTDDPA